MKTLSHGFREALHFQMFLQKEWVPYNSHVSPGENIHSHFKKDNSTPQVSEKPTATFLCIHGLLVSSPIRRTQEDQVTLVSWACINSWEVLSSVRKSFPGNHIYTLNSLPSSDSLVGIKINLHWIAEAYKLISLTDSQNVRIWFLVRARFFRGLSPFFWNLNCNSVQFKYFKTHQICMLDISGYR